MFGLGAGEMLLIGVIALVFIGPKKIPELARGLGKGLREFQKAKDDFQENIQENIQENLVEDSQRAKIAAVLPTTSAAPSTPKE
ncbi:MAG: twin-arginine translocase TatA/TatE family subunit [Bdellovibrionota bacterium]